MSKWRVIHSAVAWDSRHRSLLFVACRSDRDFAFAAVQIFVQTREEARRHGLMAAVHEAHRFASTDQYRFTQSPMGTSAPEMEKLQHLMEHYATYHNHKEQMAFAIFGLQGAFFVGLFLLGNWPVTVQRMDPFRLSMIFLVVWALFHLALRYQLRNRRLAAILVSAFYDAIMRSDQVQYLRDRHEFVPPSRLVSLVDATLWPMRGAFRVADTDCQELEDCSLIAPNTLASYKYYQAEHKRKAELSWTGYALPIEWITTIGSFLMLGIAILRVFTLNPIEV